MNYKNFFDACKKRLDFETPHGWLTVLELFELSVEDLKKLYLALKQKVVIDDDPVLADVLGESNKDDMLRFEIVRDILLDKKREAQKAQLQRKKKQLETMLNEIKLQRLKESPEAIEEELQKIQEQLEAME